MNEEIKSILYESYYHDVGISKEDIEKIMYFIENQQKEIEELKKDKLELINKHHVVHLKDVEKELREMRKEVDTKNAEIECLNVIHESYKEMIEENNYISKDKIKEKIKELNNKNINADGISAIFNITKIQTLEELLEE